MSSNKYLSKVNEFEFELDVNSVQALDLINESETSLHLLQNNRSYDIQINEINNDNKTVELSVNGTKYVVQLSDSYDQLVEQMGLTVVTAQKVQIIKAPMPGLVLDIQIEVGKSVEKGETLLILEAMKMENALQAPGEGIVKTIEVKKGQAVEKGQVLIEFE